MDKDLIITFVKNPELGKAKTRLAKSVGDQKALEIYLQLLHYTKAVLIDTSADKEIHYSKRVEATDMWEEESFRKALQIVAGLGAKMRHAFAQGFEKGYGKILLIGSDCPELTPAILKEALLELEKHEVVFGPANDGGYYLIGMKRLIPELFQHKEWSTNSVLRDSTADCQRLGLSYGLLPQLSDIDYEADWLKFKEKLSNY